jgi:hypothetical protein
MNRHSRIVVVLLLLLVAGCNYPLQREIPTSAPTSPAARLPSPAATAQVELTPRLTPYALEPAAGICDGPGASETVAIEIMPDAPAPRCIKVSPQQKLVAANRTDAAVTITIGSYQATLQPGAQQLLDVRLGDVYAPGVHVLQVQPYFGPEIWMVSP